MSFLMDHAKKHYDRAAQHFDSVAGLTDRVIGHTKKLATDIASSFEGERHSHTHLGHMCYALHGTVHNRFHSFAPPRTENNAKWFVDGCGYFWALSVAIEQAQSQIWIMDWWLSPELYLRRPPSKNEDYRLDRMLKAAAERGVKVNVMVYKEVESVLSCKSVISRVETSNFSDLLITPSGFCSVDYHGSSFDTISFGIFQILNLSHGFPWSSLHFLLLLETTSIMKVNLRVTGLKALSTFGPNSGS
jgi:hypothetical protein